MGICFPGFSTPNNQTSPNMFIRDTELPKANPASFFFGSLRADVGGPRSHYAKANLTFCLVVHNKKSKARERKLTS
jgi:hypothetical protein